MSTSQSKVGRHRGVSTPTTHARRTRYPRLFQAVNPTEPPIPSPLLWPDWTDRRTVEAEIDPELWPEWTDETGFMIPGVRKGS
jgi:hypothetical protein